MRYPYYSPNMVSINWCFGSGSCFLSWCPFLFFSFLFSLLVGQFCWDFFLICSTSLISSTFTILNGTAFSCNIVEGDKLNREIVAAAFFKKEFIFLVINMLLPTLISVSKPNNSFTTVFQSLTLRYCSRCCSSTDSYRRSLLRARVVAYLEISFRCIRIDQLLKP